MSINSLSSSVLANLAAYQTPQSAATEDKSTTAQTNLDAGSSGLSSSPSYLLSLGQKDVSKGLVSYSRLGTLINGAQKSLEAQDSLSASQITTGNGQVLGDSHRIEIKQLAQAQGLIGSSFGDANVSVADSGTLTVEFGTLGDDGLFALNGQTASIDITDTSLTGIAKAINQSGSGLTAAVIEENGQYHLQINGDQKGAAGSFRLSGISDLEFDPESPAGGALILSDAPQDARFLVDGTAYTSASNDNVEVTDGLALDLTQAGATINVTVPAGQRQATNGAKSLIETVNQLLSGLGQLGDENAANAQGMILDVLAADYDGQSLALLGIGQAADGTFSLDAAAFSKAYAENPDAASQFLDQIRQSLENTLSGDDGISKQAKSGLTLMAALMSRQQSGLVDYLNGNGSLDQQDGASKQVSSTDILALYGKTGETAA